MVMERLQEEEEVEDTGESSTTHCNNNHHHHHPHKPTTDTGICPFCLQEKLTKLVSSSSTSSFPIFPSCPSPPSPNKSFRSDFTTPKSTLSTSSLDRFSLTHNLNTSTNCHHYEYQSSQAFLRIPFVQTQKRRKNKNKNNNKNQDSGVLFNRSKSTTTPRGGGRDFVSTDENTPRKRGLFWSLLSLSRNPSSRKIENRDWREEVHDVSANGFVSTRKREDSAAVIQEENEGSPETAASDRKLSRSRSVGCGGSSRSFSGELFDRISTGFGDCALRRVESYRESKQKITAAHRRHASAAIGGGSGRDYIKESVKCSGIFSGFMANSSSSSSSSSSSYLVSTSVQDCRPAAAVVRHGRSKSWGWAFASPLRAFNKHSSYEKREGSNMKKNNSPNIHAIPSILVYRG